LSRTKTAQIADALRREISDMEPGERLPTEEALCKKYGASRGTVRDALEILVRGGVLTVRSGQGYTVRRYDLLEWRVDTFEHRQKRRDTPEAGADAWAADVIARGLTPRQDVDLSIVAPPPKVAARLLTPAGELVVVRRRLRWVDDEPVMTADSYYPRDVAEGTAIMEAGDVTIPGGLMRAAGQPQKWFRDEEIPRPPTPAEATQLQIPVGTAVLEMVRTGYNREDRPVRVHITITRGDRILTVREIEAE
jgi:DNA-binding GntR family transcriptional regulator